MSQCELVPSYSPPSSFGGPCSNNSSRPSASARKTYVYKRSGQRDAPASQSSSATLSLVMRRCCRRGRGRARFELVSPSLAVAGTSNVWLVARNPLHTTCRPQSARWTRRYRPCKGIVNIFEREHVRVHVDSAQFLRESSPSMSLDPYFQDRHVAALHFMPKGHPVRSSCAGAVERCRKKK
jgi:hypothetical protein